MDAQLDSLRTALSTKDEEMVKVLRHQVNLAKQLKIVENLLFQNFITSFCFMIKNKENFAHLHIIS